jgi:hypothetical protein
MLIRTLPPELKCKIYKNLVCDQTAQKKNLMNELKLYHRIGNFSIQIQLLIIKMITKIYPNLWPLTDRNIDYLVDVYNLMKDCNCFHCRYITFPYTLQRLSKFYFYKISYLLLAQSQTYFLFLGIDSSLTHRIERSYL